MLLPLRSESPGNKNQSSAQNSPRQSARLFRESVPRPHPREPSAQSGRHHSSAIENASSRSRPQIRTAPPPPPDKLPLTSSASFQNSGTPRSIAPKAPPAARRRSQPT